MKIFFKQKNKGFTLVETLVAISIFTVSILGLMSVLTAGISDTIYVKQKMTATYLAQEGIEHARNIRDTHVLYEGVSGWNNFLSDSGSVANYPSPDSTFTREVNMVVLGSDNVAIVCTVSWNQGSGEHHITFSETLYNWIE